MLLKLVKSILKEVKDETFIAYNGRYIFDINKAYSLINNGKITPIIRQYKSEILRSFVNPDIAKISKSKVANKLKDLEVDKPIGMLVKFQDPESKVSEWLLIDGNHRVYKAVKTKQDAPLYVIPKVEDTAKFLKVNSKIPHKLFTDY